jgi:hypothetical protein
MASTSGSSFSAARSSAFEEELKRLIFPVVALAAVLAGGATRIVQDQCGPFTDVTPGFCPYVLELYYLGVTAGTSATTFSPDDPLTRGQGSVFVAKGLNQALARSSRRAALGQWWTPQTTQAVALTPIGNEPLSCASDGADVWVPNDVGVSRIRASDGRVLETWNGLSATNLLVAMGRIFLVVRNHPNSVLAMIDPSQPAGTATVLTQNLGEASGGMAFDGSRIWTADGGDFVGTGSVSIVTPGTWAVTTVPGFGTMSGIVFDGSNMWATNNSGGTLLKLDANGAVLQTVVAGRKPAILTYDGENLWVPNAGDDSVSVIRASTGEVIGTLTGNGLSNPLAAAFDGQRILVNNFTGDSVSLWRAADLMPLGSISTGAGAPPSSACSDGINFWVPIFNGSLARF